MKNTIFIYLIIIIIFTIYSSFNIYHQNLEKKFNNNNNNNNNPITDNSISNNPFYSSQITDNFFWPIPGFSKISSNFGKRISPATGASSFHTGIDIPAPVGTNIYSVLSGKVSFIGFNGANGHTIIISSGNYNIIYAHISPNYIVSQNQTIYKGQLIGNVGPKYISDVINNPYKDSTGKTTNGSTTGCHLHLGIKKDGKAVNPLNYFFF